MARLRSRQSASVGFKPTLWLCHSKTFIFFQSRAEFDLLVCFGSLSTFLHSNDSCSCQTKGKGQIRGLWRWRRVRQRNMTTGSVGNEWSAEVTPNRSSWMKVRIGLAHKCLSDLDITTLLSHFAHIMKVYFTQREINGHIDKKIIYKAKTSNQRLLSLTFKYFLV